MTSDDTHRTLAQVVRTELTAAWQRGLDTAPHGPNALHDQEAKSSYAAIMLAVQRHIEQVTSDLWERVNDEERTATEYEAPE